MVFISMPLPIRPIGDPNSKYPQINKPLNNIYTKPEVISRFNYGGLDKRVMESKLYNKSDYAQPKSHTLPYGGIGNSYSFLKYAA